MGRHQSVACAALVLAIGLATTPLAAWAHPDLSGRYFTRAGFGRPGVRDASLNTTGGDARAFVEPPALLGAYADDYAAVLKSRQVGKPIGDTAAQCLPG